MPQFQRTLSTLRNVVAQIVLQKADTTDPDCNLIRDLDVTSLVQGLQNADAVAASKVLRNAAFMAVNFPVEDFFHETI